VIRAQGGAHATLDEVARAVDALRAARRPEIESAYRAQNACDVVHVAGTRGERARKLHDLAATLNLSRGDDRIAGICGAAETADVPLARGESFTAGRSRPDPEVDIEARAFTRFYDRLPYKPTNQDLGTGGIKAIAQKFRRAYRSGEPHTAEEHIGKSAHALRKRLEEHPNIAIAATFVRTKDAFLARNVVLSANDNQLRIHNYLRNVRDRRPLDVYAPMHPAIRTRICGREAEPPTARTIRARLTKNPDGRSFEINSIFPTARALDAATSTAPVRPTLDGPGERGEPMRIADLLRPDLERRLGG